MADTGKKSTERNKEMFIENGVRVREHAQEGNTEGAPATEKSLLKKDERVGEGLRQGC